MKYSARYTNLAAFAVLAMTAAMPGAGRAEVPRDADVTIERLSAQIRSGADLAAYLHRTQIAHSPLRYMNPAARHAFLASLRFDENGIIGFTHAGFAGLRASEAYQILALFGAQRAVPGIKGLVSRDSLDHMILTSPVSNWIRNGYYPSSLPNGKYACVPQDGSCFGGA